MTIRSMTGFAQVKGQVNAQLAFTLSLKSVNHRFLDLHFRLPSDTDSLEMKLRRMLKEKTGPRPRRSDPQPGSLGRERRRAQPATGWRLRRGVPRGGRGIWSRGRARPERGSADAGRDGFGAERSGEELETAVMAQVEEALSRLNQMREEEGRSIGAELRARMAHLEKAAAGVEAHRSTILRSYSERLQARMQELLGAQVDKERILQEAAVLVDRSDIQEEMVRLKTHVKHFLGLLDQGGEVGKKLDFLLQEMNREANTLLSKTSGLAGEALKITEMGLPMKSEIEKSREQVQNLE